MHTRRHHRVAIGLMLIAMASGCSFGERNGFVAVDLSNVELGAPQLFATTADERVLPVGTGQTNWFEVHDDEQQFCVARIAQDTVERICVPQQGLRPHLSSIVWSTDNSSLFLTEDFTRPVNEPDIWEFNLADQELTKRTDDGVTGFFDADASLDVLPFTSESGELHFFASNRASAAISTVDDVGRVRVASGLDEVIPPGQEIHPVGRDNFLYIGVSGDNRGALMVLNLSAQSVNELFVPGIDRPVVVAAATGVAIVREARALPARFEFVDIATGSIESIDLGDGPPPHGFAISPDGSGFVVLRPAAGTRELELLGFHPDSAGNPGEPIPLAPAGFLGDDDRNRPRNAWTGPGPSRIAWTSGNQLMIPTQDAQMIVFDLNEVD